MVTVSQQSESEEKYAELDEYTALVGGVQVRVILARDTEPPLVVTVYEVDL